MEQKAAKGHTTPLSAGKGGDDLIVGRTLEGVHGAFQFGIYIPCICGIKLVLKLGLTGQKGVHLVRIIKHFGIGKRLVDLVKLSQKIHDGLHSLTDNLDHRLFRVKLRILFEVAYGVTGRKDDLALIALVNPRDDFQQRGLTRTVETYYANLGTVEK